MSILVTDLLIVSIDISPFSTRATISFIYFSVLVISSGVWIYTGSRIISTSAFIASSAASTMSKFSLIAFITIASVVTTPSKP